MITLQVLLIFPFPKQLILNLIHKHLIICGVSAEKETFTTSINPNHSELGHWNNLDDPLCK